jgi:hypothetical protein
MTATAMGAAAKATFIQAMMSHCPINPFDRLLAVSFEEAALFEY